MIKKLIIIVFFLGALNKSFSQNAQIKGIILDTNEFPIENVNIISNLSGTVSNSNGYYSIDIENNKEIIIEFTHINYKKISLKFNLKDGMGFQLLREKNIKTGIITTETSQFSDVRANKLKVDFLLKGDSFNGKLKSVKKICND